MTTLPDRVEAAGGPDRGIDLETMHDELKRLADDLARDKLFHGGVVQISEGLYFRILAALITNDALITENERLWEVLRKLAPLVNYLPHPQCIKAEEIIRAALTAGDSHAD